MPADASAPRVLHLRSSCGFYGAESVIYNLVRAYTGESVAVCFEDRREPHTELTTRLLAVGHSAETIPASGAFDPGVLVTLPDQPFGGQTTAVSARTCLHPHNPVPS